MFAHKAALDFKQSDAALREDHFLWVALFSQEVENESSLTEDIE